MRGTLASFILFGAYVCVWSSDAHAEPLQSIIDVYIDQVGAIAGGAIIPELARHRELVKGTTEFSFKIDPAGHPSEVKVVSTPRNRIDEQTISRVIHDLKFPRIPKRILEEGGYEYLEFRNKMGPPDQ
jgi:hypothetical protein